MRSSERRPFGLRERFLGPVLVQHVSGRQSGRAEGHLQGVCENLLLGVTDQRQIDSARPARVPGGVEAELQKDVLVVVGAFWGSSLAPRRNWQF